MRATPRKVEKFDKQPDNQKKSKKQRGGARPGSGRKPGVRSLFTLSRLEAKRHMLQRIAESADPLLNAMLSKAWGEQHLMCRVEKGKGQRKSIKVEMVTDPELIKAYLVDDGVTLNNRHHGDERKEYYYITTKSPDISAITNSLDRAFGRPTEKVEFGEKDDEDLSDLSDGELDAEIERYLKKRSNKAA